MLKADYFLFVESTSHGDNGKLTLHNLFDIVYAEKFPTIQRPFLAAFRLIPTKKPIINQKLDLKIVSYLNGKEIAKLEASVDATVEMEGALGSAVDLSQFPFEEPGKYIFKLYINGKELAERPLLVKSTDELSEK
ncbi:MAG TPA: hypothetical protein VHB72_03010 [Candidatus Saccharimonadales bacterium]|nr:hypothetical protein [Candidatus Saccharimonadales bacterium]